MRGLAACATLLALCPRAEAREFAYAALPECPSHESVAERILARASNGRSVRISVARANGEYHGQVVLGEGADRLSRAIAAPNCAALVDALVLVVALDAEREEAAPARETDESRPEAVLPAVQDTPRPIARLVPSTANLHRWSSERPSSFEMALGLSAGVSAFVIAPAASFGVMAELATTEHGVHSRWFHPSIRGSAWRTSVATVERGTYSPRFVLTAMALDVCPFGLRAGEGNVFVPVCLRGEVGVLEAASTLEASRAWLSVGGVVRPRILFTHATTRPFVELGAALTAVVVRDVFTLPGETPVRPSLSWSVALGAGLVLR